MRGGRLARLPGKAASSRVNEKSYLPGTRESMAEQDTQLPPLFSLGMYVSAGTCTRVSTASRTCRDYRFIRINRQRIEWTSDVDQGKLETCRRQTHESRVDHTDLSPQAQTAIVLIMFTSRLG